MPIIQRLGSAGARGFGFGKTGVMYQRTIQESATITDSPARAVSYDSVISETSTAADAIESLLNSLNQVLETATGSDSIVSTRGFVSTINETATISELISTIGNQNVTASETSTATDTVSRIGQFGMTVTETASITDAPQASRLTTNSIAETGTASDAVTSMRTTSGVIVEVTLGEDQLNGVRSSNASIAETGTGTDSITGIGSGYWIATLTGATNTISNNIACDSNSNIYAVGVSDYAVNSSGVLQIAKYNSIGAIQWQRSLTATSRVNSPGGVAVDSTGNVYVVGNFRIDATNVFNSVIAKYDTNGILQWQKQLSFGTVETALQNIYVDSSGNIYTGGYSSAYLTGGYEQAILHKYDNSGTVLWQVRYGASSGTISNYIEDIVVDSSGNVYTTGRITLFSSNTDWMITTKFNSSGAIQWQRSLYGANGSTTQGYGIALDSSNNVYIAGRYYTSPNYYMQFAKYNTSGTLLWQRQLSNSNFSISYGVAVDSSDNPYFVGLATTNTYADLLIAKYNSSGTIQWQRRLGNTINATHGTGISIAPDGRVCVLGTKYESTDGFIFAKVASDGSLTGTYSVGGVDYTYAATTLTSASSSRTTDTNAYSGNTATQSITTASLTDSVTTLTSAVTQI